MVSGWVFTGIYRLFTVFLRPSFFLAQFAYLPGLVLYMWLTLATDLGQVRDFELKLEEGKISGPPVKRVN